MKVFRSWVFSVFIGLMVVLLVGGILKGVSFADPYDLYAYDEFEDYPYDEPPPPDEPSSPPPPPHRKPHHWHRDHLEPRGNFLEEQSLKKKFQQKGKTGLGLFFGLVTTGLSGKFYVLDPFGVQVSGLWYENNGYRHKAIHGRILWKLASVRTENEVGALPVELYAALGVGKQSINGVPKELSEISLGLEFPAAFIALPFLVMRQGDDTPPAEGESSTKSRKENLLIDVASAVGTGLGLLNNSYTYIEAGLQKVTNQGAIDYQGVSLSGGFAFYF